MRKAAQSFQTEMRPRGGYAFGKADEEVPKGDNDERFQTELSDRDVPFGHILRFAQRARKEGGLILRLSVTLRARRGGPEGN